jgi:GNAT superfamily N-acetyltransferase
MSLMSIAPCTRRSRLTFVARGLFVHRVHILPDADVQEAWVSLGFGRYLTAAVRDTALPVDGQQAAIDVHQASAEDIDVVMALADTLNQHHLKPPMFWPIMPAPQPAARDYNLAHLADTGDQSILRRLSRWPARRDADLQQARLHPRGRREGEQHLPFEGVVEEDVRTGGVGAALLDRTMAHLRDRSIRWCTLHFAAGNPQGAPFWLKHQFVPVEHEMERRIDDRVAWARG